MHYYAAWTDSHCLIGCWHEHKSVAEAVPCIENAGGYVVAVENGLDRCLTPQEEAEFQLALDCCYRGFPHRLLQ
jgi:hypothetical protein